MSFNDFLPSKDDPRVTSLCDTIRLGGRPLLVPVRPDNQSVMLQCFQNVERKVRDSGGVPVYGWGIHQIPKIHIEAQFHAIWQSPDGDLIDVTKEELGMSRILFVRDDTRTYTGSKVPHRRIALGDQSLVERYWVLSDQSQEILMQLLLAGFQRGHPVFRERLGGINAEIQDLKARLYAV